MALARVAASARLHPTAALLPPVRVGERCVVGAHAVLGPDVDLADDVTVAAAVVLQHASVGARCVLHPGTCVGQDGFGFHVADSGRDPAKKPQTLRVVLHNDVEIGANCTIDRGSWRDTEIGPGTKLDNLIQIGHNVHIGARCLIAAQVGIAGSTTVGDGVLIGGQAGIAQHLQIGSGAQIAAKSGVHANVPENAKVGGLPAVPIRQFHRQTITLKNLAAQGDLTSTDKKGRR